MGKTEIKNSLLSILVVFVGAILFLYTDVFCNGNCYPAPRGTMFDSFQSIVVGLIPSVVILFIFGKKIISLWLKQVLWWYMIVVFLVVSNTHDGGDILSLLFNRENTAYFLMAILFIITLIYTPLMSKKLKKNS